MPSHNWKYYAYAYCVKTNTVIFHNINKLLKQKNNKSSDHEPCQHSLTPDCLTTSESIGNFSLAMSSTTNTSTNIFHPLIFQLKSLQLLFLPSFLQLLILPILELLAQQLPLIGPLIYDVNHKKIWAKVCRVLI